MNSETLQLHKQICEIFLEKLESRMRCVFNPKLSSNIDWLVNELDTINEELTNLRTGVVIITITSPPGVGIDEPKTPL